ncbi:MAG: LCP family protein [Faecousia sp.]
MHAIKEKNGGVGSVIGWIIMIVLGVACILLGVKLIGMGILPKGIIICYFLLIAAFELLLFFTRRKMGVNIIVYICSLVVAVVLFFGYSALGKVDATVKSITTLPEVQTKVFSVIAPADSSMNAPTDLTNARVGFMDTLESGTLTQLQNKLSEQGAFGIEYVSCSGAVSAADALLNREVDAVILHSVYIDMIDEDVYEDFSDQIKVICTLETTEAIQPVQWTQIEGLPEEEMSESAAEDLLEKENLDSFVVYVSGIDTYGSVDVQSRSDVNILAVVNTKEHKVQLINTPRDYYVPLPISNGMRDKLTHAGIYGIDVSIGALEMLYDIDVDHYVRINFSGFEEIIDALGGIDVNSEYAFSARGYSYSQGINHLDGAAALVFARERYSFAAGDVQRGKNQMAVITAMIQKMLSVELLRNYATILNSISGSFQTDFTADEIYALVCSQLLSGADWSVDSYTVTGTGASEVTYSMPGARAYVMYPDDQMVATAKSLISALVD